jgi:hypothetical protein
MAALQKVAPQQAERGARDGRSCVMPRSILFIALVFLMVAPTHTFATTECSVKKTADGFVALHKAPSQKAPIIARLKPKDVVLISSEHEPSGRWIYVSKVGSNGKYGPSGWVNGRLIDDDKCG